jgi:hypothetical protein
MKSIDRFSIAPNGRIDLIFSDGSQLSEFPSVLAGEMFEVFVPHTHDQIMPHILTSLSGAVVALSIRLRALEDAHPTINRRVEQSGVLTEPQKLLGSLLQRPVYGECERSNRAENRRLVRLAKLHGVELSEASLIEFVGEVEAKSLIAFLSEQATRDQT